MRVLSYKLLKRSTGQPYIHKDTEYVCENKILVPEDIYELLRGTVHINESAEEYVYLLCLTTKMRVTALFELSHGTVSSAPISVRELMIRALLCGAVTIVIAHNHPSGDPSPSAQDLDVSRQIADACRFMGIQFADFIICGDGTYCSFRDQGLI